MGNVDTAPRKSCAGETGHVGIACGRPLLKCGVSSYETHQVSVNMIKRKKYIYIVGGCGPLNNLPMCYRML